MRDTNNGNFSGEKKAERMAYLASAGGPSIGSRNTSYCIVIPCSTGGTVNKYDGIWHIYWWSSGMVLLSQFYFDVIECNSTRHRAIYYTCEWNFTGL